MEEKETKYLEELLRKVIGESPIESPSLDFTNAVITRINELHKSEATIYKPLISKKAWVLIVIVLVLYVLFFGYKSEPSSWLASLDFKIFSNVNMDILSELTLSKTFAYAILFFALMLCIQIPLLKNHLDKRFEV